MPSVRSGRMLDKMPLLFHLAKLFIGILSRLLGITVVSVCFPRIPPRNWNSSATHVGYDAIPSFFLLPTLGQGSITDNYLDLTSVLATSRSTDIVVLDDVPALIEIPKSYIEDTPDIEFDLLLLEDSSMTMVNTSPTDISFSIYSDASSPDLNKAMFITPERSIQELQLSLLRAASKRVSDILRENRRRLDAGEDPSTIRREARRRRTQELSAPWNN